MYTTGAASLPWPALALLVGGMTVVQLALLVRLFMPWPVRRTELFANLLLDVAFLAAVLYLTGGSTNPLVSYFLIPLIISATTLRPWHTWFIALMTVACYTFLLFRHVPLALFTTGSHGDGMNAHFVGMWINFAFSATLIAWFVVRMAGTLREREKAIASAREDGLRNEQIISAASIAAGTAHELRTPLSTMTVLTAELKAQNPDLNEDLTLLEQQLGRCDRILNDLVTESADGGRQKLMSVGQALSGILDRWSLVRPEVSIHSTIDPMARDLALSVDPSFQHALLGFLHNAADVSPDDVRLAVTAEGEAILIAIEDRGPGIPDDITPVFGRRRISRKTGGLGLGVLLGSASIERLGGEVALAPRRQGGTRLEIHLPICKP